MAVKCLYNLVNHTMHSWGFTQVQHTNSSAVLCAAHKVNTNSGAQLNKIVFKLLWNNNFFSVFCFRCIYRVKTETKLLIKQDPYNLSAWNFRYEALKCNQLCIELIEICKHLIDLSVQ